jgi:hypothetical protein
MPLLLANQISELRRQAQHDGEEQALECEAAMDGRRRGGRHGVHRDAPVVSGQATTLATSEENEGGEQQAGGAGPWAITKSQKG